MSSPEHGGAGASSDRNLLYSMLALRLGLITRDQLVAGLHTWVDSQRGTIEDVLIRLGFMTSEDVSLLTPLFRSFIERHGGNADQGLSALSPIGAIRDQLAAIKDERLDNSLRHLPDDEVEPTETPSPIGERFRILAFHKRGGLGKVSVALDNELGREVAFKEIRDEYSNSQSSRERFLLEAEITGRLEHPGIVPVYGLGHFADGRPFYAMRFIRGDTLKSSLQQFHERNYESEAERRADFRRLLERFLDVCEAVDYAHARGVLHRDLKPGNIMLGRYGETLVVDWGLAKTIDKPDTRRPVDEASIKPRFGSSANSMEGVAIGTPSYMSPEQANGRLDELGPATDVFGLGAILYCVLTGQPPYQGDDALEKAKEATFAAPQDVADSIPKGLTDICMKALAARQEERYPSAGELREALWQWLTNEPISAQISAVEYFEQLYADEPDLLPYQIRLARELSTLSKVFQSLDRHQESLHAVERAVSLMTASFEKHTLELGVFQELYFSRVQLSSVLRANKRSKDANQIDEENQSLFQHMLKSQSKNQLDREELLNLTLHQGFSTEEAQKLLDAHDEEEHGTQWFSDADDEFVDEDSFQTVHVGDGAKTISRDFEVEQRYTLLYVAGQGGFSVVYRARDNLIPREVALKKGRLKEVDMSPLVRESSIMALLDHPNIIPIYDTGYLKDTNEPFLVMKYVEGTDWPKVRKQLDVSTRYGKNQWFQMLRGFSEICDAVGHAHELGIVHGDPKPSNVIVDRANRPWLFDWGLGYVSDEEKLRAVAGDVLRHLTEEIQDLILRKIPPGSVIGTPSFMSPEQTRGEGVCPASDIYVLGSSLYFLLTGQTPYEQDGANVRQVLYLVSTGEFPKPREIERNVPRGLEQICLKAMAVDPSERFQSATELGAAVRSFVK